MCVMVGVVLKAGRLYTKTSGPLAPWHSNAMFSPAASTDAPAQSMLPSLTCVMCPPEGSAQGPSEKHRLSRSQRKIFRAVLPVPIGSAVESNTTTWALLEVDGRAAPSAKRVSCRSSGPGGLSGQSRPGITIASSREICWPRLPVCRGSSLDHRQLGPIAGPDGTLLSPVAAYTSIFPAVQNLLLAARALGLGTTLTTLHRGFESDLKALLEVPAAVEVVAIVPLGHPADRFGPTRRKPVARVAFRDRWGKPFVAGGA